MVVHMNAGWKKRTSTISGFQRPGWNIVNNKTAKTSPLKATGSFVFVIPKNASEQWKLIIPI
jgi:hypothetical protein